MFQVGSHLNLHYIHFIDPSHSPHCLGYETSPYNSIRLYSNRVILKYTMNNYRSDNFFKIHVSSHTSDLHVIKNTHTEAKTIFLV